MQPYYAMGNILKTFICLKMKRKLNGSWIKIEAQTRYMIPKSLGMQEKRKFFRLFLCNKKLICEYSFCGNEANELYYRTWDICQVNMKGFYCKGNAERSFLCQMRLQYAIFRLKNPYSDSFYDALFDLLTNILCKQIF